MKCDGLKPLVFSIVDLAYIDEIRATRNFQNPHDHAVYKATEVDEAIAELKDENKLLKEHIANGDVSRITWIDEVIELKQKLHDAEMRADLAECANTEYREDIKQLKAENERLKATPEEIMTQEELDKIVKQHKHWLELAEKFKEAK